MSRSYVNSMKHFLDEKGAISDTLPKPMKRLVEHLGLIVTYVSGEAPSSREISVSCWNIIKRKKCSGKIDAGIDLVTSQIFWHCLVCGDHGSIRHWEQTPWDGHHRSSSPLRDV